MFAADCDARAPGMTRELEKARARQGLGSHTGRLVLAAQIGLTDPARR